MFFDIGETFYYANRDTKQAEKCTVIKWLPQLPMAYIAEKESTGEVFECYHDFGCFKSEQEAYNDAQTASDRRIY